MKQPFSYKIILIAGVILWLASAAIRLILPFGGTYMSGQDVIMDMFIGMKDTLSIAISLIALGIISPIFEELVFRYWIKSRKRVLTIVLFAAMGCYVAINSFWWLGCAGFIVCLIIDVALSNKPDAKTVMLMIATSLLFASAHIAGSSSFNIDTVLILTEVFGLGLVACWLMYNIGFWYACLLHTLNNIIAIAIIALWHPEPSLLYTPTEVTFDTPLYSATLKSSSEDAIIIREVNDSTVYVKGRLTSIAFLLTEEFNPSIVEHMYSDTEVFKQDLAYPLSREPLWEYMLTFHDTIPYKNAPQIVAELAKHSRLQIDTTYEYMYVLGIEDIDKVNNTTGIVSGSLANLAGDIRVSCDCPVVLEKGTNAFYPIKYGYDLLSYDDINELAPILSEKLGLYIYKSEVHKIQVIRFSDSPKQQSSSWLPALVHP